MVKDFLDLLIQYWLLIIFIGGIVWTLIKLFLNTIPKIFSEIKVMQDQLTSHDKADVKMAEALTALIDRNKTTTETASKETQDKLISMGEDLAVIKNNINLILSGKIKES